MICEHNLLLKYNRDSFINFNFIIDNQVEIMRTVSFFEINRKYNICIHLLHLLPFSLSLYYYDDENNFKEIIIDINQVTMNKDELIDFLITHK